MKTVKRLFTIFLCIITAVSTLPLTPVDVFADYAEEILISSDGNWKYAVTWGSPSPLRYDEFVCLYRYIGNEKDVIIPETIDGFYVQHIVDYCFYGDTKEYNSNTAVPDMENYGSNDLIETVFVPSTVVTIGKYAFSRMDSLKELIFEDMYSPYSEDIYISEGAFAGSPMLKKLELPEKRLEGYAGNIYSALKDSYISELKIHQISSSGSVTLPQTLEHLIITGDFSSDDIHKSGCYGVFSSYVKTVEIEGYARADYVWARQFLSELKDADGEITNYPDFIFHRVPQYKLEKLLENSGYKKRIDYETGYTEFSVNRFPLDVRYYPFNGVSYGSGIISGDYEYALTYLDNAVIIGYHGNGEEVVFPSEIDGYPVTAIGDGQNTLCGNTSNDSAVTVTIPDSVEFINKKAFYNWYALENIEFSRNLKVIESQAFRNCRSLTEIVLPDIVYLGTYAFADCGIKKVAVPSTLKEVSAMSFSEIDRSSFLSPSRILETIELSDGVEIIGTGAFEYVPDEDITDDPFVELNLPSTLIFIDYAAFNGTNIKGELKIPGGVKKIDDFAFCSNTKLTSVTLPQRLEYIGEKSFCGCVIQNALVLPDSVCKLEDCAFDALTVPEIVLPDSIIVIPNGCFNESNIEKISGGQNIKLIEDYAFRQATIGEITLPEGLKYLRHTAFDSAKIGTLFYGVNGKDFDDYNYYPAVGAFEKSEIQNLIISQTAKHIPEQVFYGAVITGRITMLPGVETICPNAFYMSTMSEITIPETVTTIGAYAFAYCTSLEKAVFSAVNCNSARCVFYGCSNLNEVTISDGVKQIPGAMFKDTDIDSIVLPESITAIGSEAFNSIKLKSIVVPENVTFIGAGAFADCTELERVDFLVKSCRLGTGEKYVFENCPALSEFNFGSKIKYIPDNLLRGSGALENVTIPASVTDIGSYSFASTKLTQIIIPEGVESIGDGCFENCACLEHITINGNIYLIGDGTFSGCGNLKEIYIADSVRNIGRSSFAGCSALETVYMSRNVVYIPESCFANCTALSTFTWEADSKLIGKLAFSGCTMLTDFDFLGIEKLYPNSFEGSGIGNASLGEAKGETNATLEVVEEQSFMNCAELQTVALGGNVSTVQTRAFANCENLETAIISESVESISPDAFDNCPKLTIYCLENSYAHRYALNNNIQVSTFVVAPIPNQKYTGLAIKPNVSVTVGGEKLSRGSDFTVKYYDNINVGTASVRVSGANDYKMFSSTVNFTIITRDISEAFVYSIDEQEYTGSAVTPSVTVTYSGRTLREGKDYTVQYSNNTSAGTANAIIKGCGNFSGTNTVNFTISESPEQTSILFRILKTVGRLITRIIALIVSLFR